METKEKSSTRLADRITKGNAEVWTDYNEGEPCFAVYGNKKCLIKTISEVPASTEAEANAELIAEAFNITNQSGYSPKELLEQRNEALKTLKYCQLILKEVSTQNCWKGEKENLVNKAQLMAEETLKKVKP